MESDKKTKITVQATIKAPVELVWKLWANPEDIVKWNHASDDWHTTRAENDLLIGGKFLSRMEAKDGRAGFDFIGVYETVKPNELIEYEIYKGRKVSIDFNSIGKETILTETFEAEEIHPIEQQQSGWQAILDNFKKYVEENN
jgi:uncharacterized protein YndB with AHSA1/START domain